jgi:hypothetical protein
MSGTKNGNNFKTSSIVLLGGERYQRGHGLDAWGLALALASYRDASFKGNRGED